MHLYIKHYSMHLFFFQILFELLVISHDMMKMFLKYDTFKIFYY